MMFRRLVVSVLLVLFALSATVIIVGLDDGARSLLLRPRTDDSNAHPSVPSAQTSIPTTRPPAAPAPTPTPPTTTASASASPRSGGSAPSGSPRPRERGKAVYLTFDDGPSPYTPQVLDILRSTGSTATFFQLGVNTHGQAAIQAAIRAQGSNIGNHSLTHPDLTRLGSAELRRQIVRGPPSRCFRPPYGATNGAVRAAITRAGARQILWTVDTRDWQRPGASVLARVGKSKEVRDGSILLLHDGGGDRRQTVAALPALIGNLQARGFAVRALPTC